MIVPAKTEDSELLTEVSFAAKRYWNYPQENFDIWRDELTITPDYIDSNIVYVIMSDNILAGYFSIVELKSHLEICGVEIRKGFWLDHMFLKPEFIGKGLGTQMFVFMKNICREKLISELGIMADPNAKGFYEKMGCEYTGELPSTITGRTTPYFTLTFS